MRIKRVIKWIHGLITAGLLLIVIGFVWLNHPSDQRESDVLQSSYHIDDNLWLYATRNDSGGATVATVYRYYLATQLPGNDRKKIRELNRLTPFMEGYGTISSVAREADNMLKVVYSGKVLSLDDTAHYSANGALVTIKLLYQIN